MVLYADAIEKVEQAIKFTKESNNLNFQEFINFQDKLNEYSIDPDRD